MAILLWIINEMIEDYKSDKIKEVQYALIDCGNDGKKQLALRAYGLGIYLFDDTSNLTMVFDYKEGTVSMVYAVDAWARSDKYLFNNGYVFGTGSGGTACHRAWGGIIGADGIYHKP